MRAGRGAALVLSGGARWPEGIDRRTRHDAIADTARLERMAEQMLDAAGWDALLATP